MKAQKNGNHKAFASFDLSAFYLAPAVLLAATLAESLEGGDNLKVSTAGGMLTCFAFILFTFVVLRHLWGVAE